jgi:hypothetical protein
MCAIQVFFLSGQALAQPYFCLPRHNHTGCDALVIATSAVPEILKLSLIPVILAKLFKKEGVRWGFDSGHGSQAGVGGARVAVATCTASFDHTKACQWLACSCRGAKGCC